MNGNAFWGYRDVVTADVRANPLRPGTNGKKRKISQPSKNHIACRSASSHRRRFVSRRTFRGEKTRAVRRVVRVERIYAVRNRPNYAVSWRQSHVFDIVRWRARAVAVRSPSASGAGGVPRTAFRLGQCLMRPPPTSSFPKWSCAIREHNLPTERPCFVHVLPFCARATGTANSATEYNVYVHLYIYIYIYVRVRTITTRLQCRTRRISDNRARVRFSFPFVLRYFVIVFVLFLLSTRRDGSVNAASHPTRTS